MEIPANYLRGSAREVTSVNLFLANGVGTPRDLSRVHINFEIEYSPRALTAACFEKTGKHS